MIVPDASVIALLFGEADHEPRQARAMRELRADPEWIAPEHWRTEVLSAVRGLVRGRKMDADRAEKAVAWLQKVTVISAPTGPLLKRMWELKDNLSTYDAAYVAVAEAHQITLVTADARIARSGAARCPVLVVL